MQSIKSYTNIEQSKQLAEILPIETADMCYILHSSSDNPDWRFDNDIPPMVLGKISINELTVKALPCWSLAALLNILPKIINNESLFIETSAALWHIGYRNIYTVRASNIIDACYELIVYLHELNLL